MSPSSASSTMAASLSIPRSATKASTTGASDQVGNTFMSWVVRPATRWVLAFTASIYSCSTTCNQGCSNVIDSSQL